MRGKQHLRQRPFYQKWWFISIVVIMALALVCGAIVGVVLDNRQPTDPSDGEDSFDDPSATAVEKDAVSRAKQYLKVMQFSKSGLIRQLEFEGYTAAEATYGVDNCGADWYEQAKQKAQEYINNMAFSRQGLITQLELEGFTHEEAVYGVEQNGY